jgi:hypothetical protein
MEILGIPEGKKVGEIKKNLEDMVLDGTLKNRKRDLKRYLKTLKVEMI